MLNRRHVLGFAAGAAGIGLTANVATAAKPTATKQLSARAGGIDPAAFGVRPGAAGDQSEAFGKMLKAASDANQPILLSPGAYIVSGKAMDRLLDSVNFDNEESLNYFHRTLRRIGVIDALREQGAGEGDSVIIGEMEFDFVD